MALESGISKSDSEKVLTRNQSASITVISNTPDGLREVGFLTPLIENQTSFPAAVSAIDVKEVKEMVTRYSVVFT